MTSWAITRSQQIAWRVLRWILPSKSSSLVIRWIRYLGCRVFAPPPPTHTLAWRTIAIWQHSITIWQLRTFPGYPIFLLYTTSWTPDEILYQYFCMEKVLLYWSMVQYNKHLFHAEILVNNLIWCSACIDLRRHLWDRGQLSLVLGDSNCWRRSNKYFGLLTQSIHSTSW